MNSPARTILPGAILLCSTGVVASAAPQIDVEGRLNLTTTPGFWWSDSLGRFFDIDGDGGKDLAYGGDDTDQSYLVIRADRSNGVYDVVHQRSWIDYVIPSAIAAGDVDGDGVREVAYATALNTVVLLQLGADGQYAEAGQFPIQSTYLALEMGDVDGDGDVDIVGLRNDGTVRIHANQNGSFPGAPTILPLTLDSRALALADMDGDADQDLVVASAAAGAEISVLLNNGNGTFAPALATGTTSLPTAMLLADFDQDGALDVATANPLSSSVRVLRNLGGGLLAAPVASPAGFACQRLDAGDVDGDGEPDLVVVGGSTGSATVLVHVGGGSFAPPVGYPPGPLTHAAITDLDGDGDQDLALTDREALRNRGDGTFAADANDPSPVSSGTFLADGDLDGDGDDDLVLQWYGGIAVRTNLGDGTLGPAVTVFGPTTQLWDLRLADADGDGDLDMLVRGLGTSGIRVLVNQGGTFGAPITIGASSGASPLEVGDLDGDGRTDLVAKIGSAFSVALNTGGSTWAPFVALAGVGSTGFGWGLGDVDGDGDPDIVSSSPTTLRVHANQGGLVFAAPVVVAPFSALTRVLAEDFDADGDLDLVASSVASLDVLWNQGGGAFAAPVRLGQRTDRLAAKDLDHDGDLDVLGSFDETRADLYENLGGAAFAPDRPAGIAGSTSVAAIDIDRDGDEDLYGVNAQLLFVLENRGRTGAAFCAGDGSGTPCPCGNASPLGAGIGCLNTTGRGGKLTASGSSSLRTDTLRLRGAGMTNSSALYFQGTAAVAGGAGAVFGDGLRCVGGSVIRLGVVSNVAGQSTFPSSTQPPLRVIGQVTSAGTRMYQVWYRDAAPFCTTGTWSLTNGLSVVWRS